MSTVNASRGVKTVADPIAEYESLRPLWAKGRAVCGGERFVKDYDSRVNSSQGNLLIPFSPSMTQDQYNFFRAEAELPGVVAQFARMIVGGLLRKQPVLSLPQDTPEEARAWILEEFGQDDSTLAAFLDEALWEELQTSRAWIYVDHPAGVNFDDLTPAERKQVKPYPVLWKAETVINWRTRTDLFGKSVLDRVIVRGFEEQFSENEFHASFIDTVRVHELDEAGDYQIRIYRKAAEDSGVKVTNGKQQLDLEGQGGGGFILEETIVDILMNGERLRYIPAWPLNGSVNPTEPSLTSLVDKEISLYNKVSRRNHLLYGAATYTPILKTDMSDDDFARVVSGGLGTWIRLRPEDDAKILETPTAALQDMDRAIASSIEDMARLGIRMMSPETAQSGVALELRNASQNAQLGTLNTKVSNIMKQVICFMLNWRYDAGLTSSDVDFQLSSDFNPTPLGADWLRLATEWYQLGLIPRSVWLQMLKQNDMLSPDYDDDKGKQEISAGMEDLAPKTSPALVDELEKVG